MRTRAALCLLVGALAGPAPASSQEVQLEPEPDVLTLAEAVERALIRNELIIETRDGLEQARLSVSLADSYFAPKFVPNVRGSFAGVDVANQVYQFTVSKRFVTGTEVQADIATTSSRNQIGDFWNTDTTLSLRQPLLRGFGSSVTGRDLMASRARVDEATRLSVLTERQVALDVVTAYYRIVSQELLVGVAAESLARSRDLVEASQARLRAGRVSQLDVFRAQQAAAEAEGQLLDARGAAEDARDLLRDLLDLSHDYRFRVEADIPAVAEMVPPGEAAAVALDNSLRVQNARQRIEESERDVQFAKNQLLPELNVGVGLYRGRTAETIGSTFGLDDYRVTTLFSASAPIDKTPQVIAYNNALIERDRRRRAAERVERDVVAEARREARRLERLFRGLEIAESQVEFAESEVEVAMLRYRRGLADNLDLVNAQLNLMTAESQMFTTRAELVVSSLRLRAIMGILDVERDIGTSSVQDRS